MSGMKDKYKLLDMFFIFLSCGALGGLIQNLGLNPLLKVIAPLKILIFGIMIYRLCNINIRKTSGCFGYIYIILGCCLLNLLVTQNMKNSLETIIYLILNVLYAYFLYCNYSIEEVLYIMFIPLAFVSVASTIFSVVLPQYGKYYDVVYYAQVWRGIFTHKNTLGNMSALLILIAIISKKVNKKSPIFFISIISAVANLMFSHSNTPKYSLIICMVYLLAKKVIKKELAGVVLGVTWLINYIYIFQYNNIEKIFKGYNVTVTGRRQIYDVVLALISKKPILGYGLSSSWIDGTITCNTLLKYIGFNPNSSHNGYLELVLNIGVIGLIGYLIMLVTIFVNSHREYRKEINSNKIINLMVFIVVMSMFESTLSQFDSLYWIIQSSALFYIVGKTEVNNQSILQSKDCLVGGMVNG